MPHMLSFPYEASLSPLLPIEQHEAVPRAASDDTASDKSFDCLSPLTMSPAFERGTLAHWSDVSRSFFIGFLRSLTEVLSSSLSICRWDPPLARIPQALAMI
jgi:hypothetical protein